MGTLPPNWPAAKRSTWPRDVRQPLDKVLAAALAAVEPGRAVRRFVRRDGDSLVVDNAAYDLRRLQRVVVVGAGKASAPMAAAVEDIIDGRADVEGVVTVRYGHAAPTRSVRIREAS